MELFSEDVHIPYADQTPKAPFVWPPTAEELFLEHTKRLSQWGSDNSPYWTSAYFRSNNPPEDEAKMRSIALQVHEILGRWFPDSQYPEDDTIGSLFWKWSGFGIEWPERYTLRLSKILKSGLDVSGVQALVPQMAVLIEQIEVLPKPEYYDDIDL